MQLSECNSFYSRQIIALKATNCFQSYSILKQPIALIATHYIHWKSLQSMQLFALMTTHFTQCKSLHALQLLQLMQIMAPKTNHYRQCSSFLSNSCTQCNSFYSIMFMFKDPKIMFQGLKCGFETVSVLIPY